MTVASNPCDLTVQNITTNSCQLKFYLDTTDRVYQIRFYYRTSLGTDNLMWQVDGLPGNGGGYYYYNVSGLSSNSQYWYAVRAAYDTGDATTFSAWVSVPYSFYTQRVYPTPSPPTLVCNPEQSQVSISVLNSEQYVPQDCEAIVYSGGTIVSPITASDGATVSGINYSDPFQVTVYGLVANTSYTAKARIKSCYGVYSGWSSLYSFTTLPVGTAPTILAATPSGGSVLLHYQYAPIPYGVWTNFYLYNSDTGQFLPNPANNGVVAGAYSSYSLTHPSDEVTNNSMFFTISDLAPGHYKICSDGADDNLTRSPYSGFAYFTISSAVSPPSINSFTSVDQTTAQINFSWGATNNSQVNIFIYTSEADANSHANSINDFHITDKSQTALNIGGLSPYTHYYVRAYSTGSDSSTSDWTPIAYLLTRPSDFTGLSSVTPGGSVYQTVDNGNGTYTAYIMPATEWASFTTKINQFRAFKNLSAYNFTTVSRDTLFSASVVNEAVNAINVMGYSIPLVTAGQDISYTVLVTNLKNTLNSIT